MSVRGERQYPAVNWLPRVSAHEALWAMTLGWTGEQTAKGHGSPAHWADGTNGIAGRLCEPPVPCPGVASGDRARRSLGELREPGFLARGRVRLECGSRWSVRQVSRGTLDPWWARAEPHIDLGGGMR
jgi:hypothetical protein